MDWNGYSMEGIILAQFGIEGITYTMVNGWPKWTDLMIKNPDGLNLNDAKNKLIGSGGVTISSEFNVAESIGNTPATRQLTKSWTKGWLESEEQNLAVPAIYLTPEEARVDIKRIQDIKTLVNEKLDKFITGAEPMENWDKFVAQLKQMGIEESVKVRQVALERWRQRGNIKYEIRYETIKSYKDVELVTKKGYDFMDADLKK